MGKFIDISVPLSNKLPTWTDSHGITISPLMTHKKDGWNVSRLDIDVHSGTHIDAPLHIIPKGKTTDEIPLEKLIGECYVADFQGLEMITAANLAAAKLPKGLKKLLLKTNNSELWKNLNHKFDTSFCALTADAAQWIVDKGIHFVGIDYLSIQLYDDSPETHVILLENEVVILESVNLLNVEPGFYKIMALPIKVAGVEGISTRAVLETFK